MSNCSCDWCEEVFDRDEADPEEFALDDALDAAGWLIVRKENRIFDFCSTDCLKAHF